MGGFFPQYFLFQLTVWLKDVPLSKGVITQGRGLNHRVLLRPNGHSCRRFLFFQMWDITLEAVESSVGSFRFTICLLIWLVIHTCSFFCDCRCGRGLRLCKYSRKEGAACVLMDLVCMQPCSDWAYAVQGTGYGLKAQALIRATTTQFRTTERCLYNLK